MLHAGLTVSGGVVCVLCVCARACVCVLCVCVRVHECTVKLHDMLVQSECCPVRRCKSYSL